MVLTTILKMIREHDLLQKGDTVFVALSGGADSVALLHAMLALRDKLELSQVNALHVHHGIRGEYADRDEQFVRKLCEKQSVDLQVKRVNVPEEVKKTGESIEEAARRLRYAFFEEASAAVPCSKIATAHTADDQAETVLLRLIRGCGLRGITGIPVKRDAIIRPLLSCTASDVRSYCACNQFDFIVDETNNDLHYSRNRVRHELLPSMNLINPSAARALIRFADLAAEDDRFLTSLAEELTKSVKQTDGSYNIKALINADTAIRKRSLQQICQAEYTHITCLNEYLETGGTVNLPGDRSAVSDGVSLRIVQHSRKKSATENTVSVSVSVDEPLWFHENCYIPRVISYKEFQEKVKINKNLLNSCVSYDMIGNDMVLRSRKAGDCLHPYGRGCTKTLKKLWNENHISLVERRNHPVLVSDDKVLMVLGLCVDESVAITPATQNVLWFETV